MLYAIDAGIVADSAITASARILNDAVAEALNVSLAGDPNVIRAIPFGGNTLALFVRVLDPGLPATSGGFPVWQHPVGKF